MAQHQKKERYNMTQQQEAVAWHKAGFDIAEIAWMMNIPVHLVQEYLR